MDIEESVSEEWANLIVRVTATVNVPIPNALATCWEQDRQKFVWTVTAVLLVLTIMVAGAAFSMIKTVMHVMRDALAGTIRRFAPEHRGHDDE